VQALSFRHGLLIWPHRNLRKFPKSLSKQGRRPRQADSARHGRFAFGLLAHSRRGLDEQSRFSSQFERTFESFPSTPTIAPVTLISDRDGVGYGCVLP
jgi:hypothetical protein